MTQFLFLHPTNKRLVDSESESVFLSFIKYYRQNDLKKQIQELINAFYAIDSDQQSDLIELEVGLFGIINIL